MSVTRVDVLDTEQNATFLSNDQSRHKFQNGDKTKIDLEMPETVTEGKKILNNNCEIPVVESIGENCCKKTDRSTGWRQYLGLILAALASLFLSSVLVLVKILRAYHPFSLSMWRQLGNVIPSIAVVLYLVYWKKENIFDHVWPIETKENKYNWIGLAVRGFLGATVIILRFSSLVYLTIADTTVITYTGPIFIIICAYFFLNEKNGFVAVIVGIWTLFGVVLIARPPFLTGADIDINILIGTGITLMSVVCQSAVTILVRKIRKIHFAVMTLAFGICGFAQSVVVSLAFGVLSVPEGLTDIGLTALMSILSYFGQICTIMSLKFEDAGPVSLIRTVDVLFAFMWQILLLDVLPDSFSILGATVVMIGVLVTATRKWVSTLPEATPTRRNLGWLLK